MAFSIYPEYHNPNAPTNTTNTTNTAMEAPTLALPLLLECRLCDFSFDTADEKRQHAKSDWHVYKIRCRVAEPGTIVPPPDSQPKPLSRRSKASPTATTGSPKSLQTDDESDDEDSDSDTSSDTDLVEFVPEECLFCNRTSQNLDQNLSHMHQAHSLVVPFQSALIVDLRTLIWFLHMVIFSYRECICCGKRRHTVEAVQQHMTSLGHCRFNVVEEMTEFYDMDSLGEQSVGGLRNPDDHTLRLPSGKLLGHRSNVENMSKSRQQEDSAAGPSSIPISQSENVGLQTLSKRDRKEQALMTQISQLRAGDQRSLMHLPEAQQRSLLLAHKKELDQAKRAERRKRGRVDHVGNMTTIHTKYYKQEVPVYMGG